jgi:hypothetical protein
MFMSIALWDVPSCEAGCAGAVVSCVVCNTGSCLAGAAWMAVVRCSKSGAEKGGLAGASCLLCLARSSSVGT